MPPRISPRTITSFAPPPAPAVPQQLETPYDSNIHRLRRHWKWAAFSQFFFTFSPLLAMTDVMLVDIENDLAHSTNRVLSRIMQRLLITLTQDRKIAPDTWQNALRRQYQRRDPEASPIGLETHSKHFIAESSRASTAPPRTLSEMPPDEPEREDEPMERDQPSAVPFSDDSLRVQDLDYISIPKVEGEDSSSETLEAPEKQVDWLDLSTLSKLESLHTLAEWQFQNPHRLRQQMKDDDELATWRVEPIGYDAKRNAYWLIGERLWIQREPSRPDLKRKRKPGGKPRKATKEHSQSLTAKRQRIDLNLDSSRRTSSRSMTRSQPPPSSKEGRTAKVRANQRLNAQAMDLADFRRQMSNSRNRTTPIVTRKPTGIRVSARLRGTAVEDEWQEVPDDWLATNNTYNGHVNDLPSAFLPFGKKRTKTGLESDDSSISELTELSDGEGNAVELERESDERPVVNTEARNPTSPQNDTDAGAEDGQDGVVRGSTRFATPSLPDDFVEWETICVTLGEWECIGQQFEKATHYAEKALHKILSQSIVPMVTAELREVERKRHVEEAVVHRKRSSRIAMKEIEKQEERAATRKRLEADEKMSRARRLEARQQREHTERLRRENAREQRWKEREQQSAETLESDPNTHSPANISEEETNMRSADQNRTITTLRVAPINGTGSGSRSPVENWELDCEICGRKGINQDDGVPLLCCGVCGKWQHIICHDKQDTMAGHPKRNWDSEDFICRQCHLMTSKCSSPSYPPDFLSLGVNSKIGQASGTQALYASPSNHARSCASGGYYLNAPSNARYPHDLPSIQTTLSSSSNSYPSQTPSTDVTFAHYQPQQGGFSTSRPTHSVQEVSPDHARYSITPHPIPSTGIAPYPSTFHRQAVTHSPTRSHEQWFPSSSYPRTINSYPINGAPRAQPYYNGNAHTAYSHMRGTNPVLQYPGLQHVPPYQHGK